MVQLIFLVTDPIDPTLPPVVQPGLAPIYRIDQAIVWKIMAEGWQWAPEPAIKFPEGSPWQGSQPTPIGSVPSGLPDLRLYQAAGPGPNMDPEPQEFAYDIFVTRIGDENLTRIQGIQFDEVDPETQTAKVHKIDPDIENRPQP